MWVLMARMYCTKEDQPMDKNPREEGIEVYITLEWHS